jgi:protein TonB
LGITGVSTKGARKIGGDNPRYPEIAKSAHVQGHVRIAAQIGEDGRIIGMRVVSGPPLLRQAALDAVRTWRYDPVTIDGVPVSVVTEIDINFSFGPG